ncbi:MAG TPA: HAMP domain-containing sensor histidine kinase [Gaiellaceae bacterium]|nr:HAMP domain-containing sensor histidine kinase [Gaiellaceae bacterium]
MSKRFLPHGIRSRLLLAVVLSVGVALVVTITAFNLILGRNLSHEADAVVKARARAQVAALQVENGRLVETEAPEDTSASSLVWIYGASGHALEAPRVGANLNRQARLLSGSRERLLDSRDGDVRLFVLPVLDGNRRVGTVITGVSLEPYSETRSSALVASLGLGAALLLIVVLAARWALSSALRPVSQMTAEAAAWSDRDLDRRFRLGDPHDELTQLAATLDGLLDRLAASMRREQRFSAEISHELRTPLARISAEADLALRRDRDSHEYRATLQAIRRDAEQLSRALETLVAAARQESGPPRGTADAAAAAEAVIEACTAQAGERSVDVILERPQTPIRVGVDPDVAERILQPLVENACRYGHGRVQISIDRNTDNVTYTVKDDGPGIAGRERDLIFEPGVRGSAAADNGDGAGLGLALARRLARAAGGDVDAEPSPSGGIVRASLPIG